MFFKKYSDKINNFRRRPGSFGMSFSYLMRLLIVLAFFKAFLDQKWIVVFLCSLALVLTFLPLLFKRKYNILIPAEFELIFVLFIYTSIILGEVHGYYTKIWWWDVLLHSFAGVTIGFIGFIIMYIFYFKNLLHTSAALIAVFSFCFALALGAIWEIVEFTIDSSLGFNMQKSGLVDTMWDLIVDALGALFTSIIGYVYVKFNKGFIINRLMANFVKKNPELFKN
ncbi:MAG: hypothetical protein KKA65_01910 [Nanoarchaeota archaeon]|nr:hypothetical protein [Nanoarchaeota archaeon]MBU4456232.1 hypothetical protein [Nanoarchaeota archaeon]